MNERLKIAVNTGGGDAPGLNAVIYAVTMAAERRGWEVYGIHTGYAGLLDTDQITRLTPEKVVGIVSSGRHDPRHDEQGGSVQHAGQERRRGCRCPRCLRAGPLQLQAPRSGRPGRHRRRRLAAPRQPLRRDGDARGGGAQDDRQRPRQYGHHLRVRYGGLHVDGGDRQASFHRQRPRTGDGGRTDGALRRLDRAQQRHLRVGGRDPDPRDSRSRSTASATRSWKTSSTGSATASSS